jgi:hypothetical protein
MSACVEVLNNELDFGVIDDDLSINVELNGLELDPPIGLNEYKNPLFVNINNTPLDNISKKDLHCTYKHVYILVMKDTYNNEHSAEHIFSYVLTDDIVNEFSKYFTLIKVNNSILYNKKHYKSGVVVDKKFMLKFNDLPFDSTEIVIPMYELKESIAIQYLSQYSSSTQISEIENTLTFMNVYTNNNKHIFLRQLKQQTDNLKETHYWKSKKNCNINMTETFMNRKFRYHEYESIHVVTSSVGKKNTTQNPKIIDILNKLSGHSEKKEKQNYELQNVHTDQKFIDVAESLKQSPDRTYYAVTDEQLDVSKEDVNRMFQFLTCEKELFTLFNSFLTSKNLCHMVLNNKNILEKMQPIINKYLSFYRYSFGYAWMSLYVDECIFKKKTKIDNRFVFDIDTASKLPFFPVCAEDLHLNPYFTVPISKSTLDGTNNCLSLKMVRDYDGYGISDMKDFQRKFNIFTTGKQEHSIFDGIDWDNFAVAGSVTCACIPKRSPLIDTVTISSMTETEKYNAYFNNFYRESDIDLMCIESSVFNFMDKVLTLVDIVKTNIEKSNDNITVCESLTVKPLKSMAVIVHVKYIEELIDEIRETLNEPTLEAVDVIKRIGDLEIKDFFYDVYLKYKMEAKRKLRDKRNKNELYNAYFKMSDMDDMNIKIVDYEIEKEKHVRGEDDYCLYYNDIVDDDKKVSINKNIMVMKICENMKFKLESPDLLHTIEVFRISGSNYFSTVSGFHLPCVRSFYNGTNVFMTASCITAMMTGINIEYKYFAGIRDPIEILMKYQSRGFGTILNENERYHMAYYCSNINVNNGYFGTDIKHKENINKLYGPRTLNDEIYKVGKHKYGVPDECFHVSNKEYIETVDDVQKWFNKKCPTMTQNEHVNYLKLKCIDEKGDIIPYKTWVSETIM